MVTYKGSLWIDDENEKEKEKLRKIIDLIDKRSNNLSASIQLDYWIDQKQIFERKLLALELQDIIDSVV